MCSAACASSRFLPSEAYGGSFPTTPVPVCMSAWPSGALITGCTHGLQVRASSERLEGRRLKKKPTDSTGQGCEMVDLTSLCRQFNVHLVEDAFHAHGATFMDRKIGSFGTVSVFSLQANKPVAAGEGGLLLTDSQEIYERATLIGHFGPRA